MFYFHDSIGTFLHTTERTLEAAIKTAKKFEYPVQVNTKHKYPKDAPGVFGSKQYFKMVYAHIPEGCDIKGTQMSAAMIHHKIEANTVNLEVSG